MKKTFIGWIGKDKLNNIKTVRVYGGYNIPDVYQKKGLKDYWNSDEWPPVKVKITVETVEK